MKKLLIPLLFLSFLLTACADVTSDTYNHIETTTDTTAEDLIIDTTAVYVPIEQVPYELETELPNEEITQISEIITEAIEVSSDAAVPYERKLIYLTFDDGPGKYTDMVLEILDEYDVTATFFMVGRFMRNNPDKVRVVNDSENLIGCHSMTHDYRAIYKDTASITSDIEEWEGMLFEITGEEVTERLYRFPGGSTCSAIEADTFPELYEAVRELGYRSFDWTCANNDLWLGDKSDEESMEEYMRKSLIKSLKLGGEPKILLLHESVEGTVEMLPWIIEYIRGEGYEFAPLTELDGEYLFSH